MFHWEICWPTHLWGKDWPIKLCHWKEGTMTLWRGVLSFGPYNLAFLLLSLHEHDPWLTSYCLLKSIIVRIQCTFVMNHDFPLLAPNIEVFFFMQEMQSNKVLAKCLLFCISSLLGKIYGHYSALESMGIISLEVICKLQWRELLWALILSLCCITIMNMFMNKNLFT